MAEKREIKQIFDLIFKDLMYLSDAAVIHFINGLFGKNHPLDSSVEHPNTESVSKSLKRLHSDMIIIIGGVHAYHIEAEIKGGGNINIVIRVFEYGLAEALRTKTVSEGGRKISIKFPEARVIYWESSRNTPDEVTLALEYPDGGSYEYRVKAFKFLEHEVEELERGKLAILLPFYVLKLRRKAVSAKTSQRRAELAAEMKAIMDSLVAAIDRARETGLMSEPDEQIVMEHMERLYKELFAQFGEFKEADIMLRDRILTYSEEAAAKAAKKATREAKLEKAFDVAKKMLARGMALPEIADIVELPVEKLQTILSR